MTAHPDIDVRTDIIVASNMEALSELVVITIDHGAKKWQIELKLGGWACVYGYTRWF
jgi:hypothetical protein